MVRYFVFRHAPPYSEIIRSDIIIIIIFIFQASVGQFVTFI